MLVVSAVLASGPVSGVETEGSAFASSIVWLLAHRVHGGMLALAVLSAARWHMILWGADNSLIPAMENLRSGVTSVRVPEVAADCLRPALGAPQEAPHASYQDLTFTGAFSSHGVGLDILIQKLVRVELGAVTTQTRPDCL